MSLRHYTIEELERLQGYHQSAANTIGTIIEERRQETVREFDKANADEFKKLDPPF